MSFFDEEDDELVPLEAEEQQQQPEMEDPMLPFDEVDVDGLGLAGSEQPEEAEPEQPQQPEPQQQQQKPDASERRRVLEQLAKKAKAGGDDGKKAKKSSKKRDKQQQQEQEKGGSGRPKRHKPSGGDAADGGGSGRQRGGPELSERIVSEKQEGDDDFIDDEGVAPEDRYEEDVEAVERAEEAEEALPGEEEEGPTSIVDEVLKGRKRKKKLSDDQIDADVAQLLSQMLAAAKADLRIIESHEKKPATAKFQALKNVDELLRQRSHYESFIQQNGLTTLASWLRPYPNGALPLIQIRMTLVDLLSLMALDTSNDYTREKLEESELGKIIMFYSQNPHEKSMALKTKCRDLILAWSAPIFADADAEQRKRRIREREHRHRMVQEREHVREVEQREKADADKRRKANPGDEGFRARAAVPQPSKLDFVINPGSRIDPLDGPRAGGLQPGAKSAKPKSPMPEKLAKTLAAKKRGTKDRFGGMSVEGRGMMV